MQLSTTEHEQLYAILQQYDENPQVQRMREFIQHGDVTTYQHCKNVVRVSFWLNRRLHLHADETSLAVGAFLHDFYLYDWHKRHVAAHLPPCAHLPRGLHRVPGRQVLRRGGKHVPPQPRGRRLQRRR